MHVAHLLAPVPVFRAAEAMWDGFDSRPGHDRVSDAIAGCFHADLNSPMASRINKPTVGLL
jgi:hypothetical protein